VANGTAVGWESSGVDTVHYQWWSVRQVRLILFSLALRARVRGGTENRYLAPISMHSSDLRERVGASSCRYRALTAVLAFVGRRVVGKLLYYLLTVTGGRFVWSVLYARGSASTEPIDGCHSWWFPTGWTVWGRLLGSPQPWVTVTFMITNKIYWRTPV